MREELEKYLGKIVCLSLPQGNTFGQLAANEDKSLFGFANIGFPPEKVKEIVPIEVEEGKNLARATIVLE